jgi:hypothetical protein
MIAGLASMGGGVEKGMELDAEPGLRIGLKDKGEK